MCCVYKEAWPALATHWHLERHQPAVNVKWPNEHSQLPVNIISLKTCKMKCDCGLFRHLSSLKSFTMITRHKRWEKLTEIFLCIRRSRSPALSSVRNAASFLWFASGKLLMWSSNSRKCWVSISHYLNIVIKPFELSSKLRTLKTEEQNLTFEQEFKERNKNFKP